MRERTGGSIGEKTVRPAAAQIQSVKTRIARRLQRNPIRRNEHFLKCNLGASPHDEEVCAAAGLRHLKESGNGSGSGGGPGS